MVRKLEVLKLTPESFIEFGQVITTENIQPDGGDENFAWWERVSSFENIDSISVNILQCKKREFKVDKLEYHKETPEAIIPLAGEHIILVVATAGELDESRIKAFSVDTGIGVVLNVGVRHFIPYPINKNVNCVIIFKDATGGNDLILEELSESYEITVSNNN